MSYKVILSGFKTKEQAKRWLDWYEGQGEQDDTIGIWMGDESMSVKCDIHTGMIEHDDGWEYKLNIISDDDEDYDTE